MLRCSSIDDIAARELTTNLQSPWLLDLMMKLRFPSRISDISSVRADHQSVGDELPPDFPLRVIIITSRFTHGHLKLIVAADVSSASTASGQDTLAHLNRGIGAVAIPMT